MNVLTPLGSTALTMLALDAGWLTFRNSYHQSLFRDIQGSPLTMRVIPALLIYILLPSAVYLGALKDATSLKDAVIKSAMIGFILYAFYDLTNYATLRGWTLGMTVIDVMWGTLLCAIGGAAGYFMSHR